MRAFYCITEKAWDADPSVCGGQVVEVSRANGIVNLLAPADPFELLEALGALRMGGKLSELAPNDAKHFTTTRVSRLTEVNGKTELVEMAVSSTQIELDDEDLGEPPTPRVIFAGDDPADYL